MKLEVLFIHLMNFVLNILGIHFFSSSTLKWVQEIKSTPLRLVSDEDPEAHTILNLFRQGVPTAIIRKIYLIKSEALQAQYNGYKTEFKLRLGEDGINERRLWHGTKNSNVSSILLMGFNRDYCSTSVAYGKGVYFAKDADYSARSYSLPDHHQIRRIFCCRVLVGDFYVGKRGDELPEPKHDGCYYDSRVNRLDDPSIFVACKDQAIADALIEFTL